MSTKSRKRQSMVANLYRICDDPHRLFQEIMKLSDYWCRERHLSTMTKDEAVQLAGIFLKDRGFNKLSGATWAAQVIEQAQFSPGPRTVSVAIYRDLLIKLVNSSIYTHKQVVDHIMCTYPTLNRKSVQTYLSDSKSWKFTHLEVVGLIIEDAETGVLSFDKINTRPANIPPYRNPNRRRRLRSVVAEAQSWSSSGLASSVAASGASASQSDVVSQQFMVTVVPVDA